MTNGEILEKETKSFVTVIDDSRGLRNPALLYMASLSSRQSQRVTESRLQTIAGALGRHHWRDIDWSQLDRQWLYLAKEVLRDLSPSSLNAIFSVLKGVALQAWELGLINDKAFQRIKQTKSLRASRIPKFRYLQPEEISAMINECIVDDRLQGTRDAAIFALLYGCGLRRAELVGINVDDIDVREQAILIHGKGNKERKVYVPEKSWLLLHTWLCLMNRADGPAFVRIRKSNQLSEMRLTDHSVYFLTKWWIQKSGMENFTPHDFRASFISFLLDNGEDIKTVADCVGHNDIRTTSIYDRRGERIKKQAALKIRF